MGARNVHRLEVEALKAGEKCEMQSGEALKFLPKVDDQGALNVGDGTNDMDFKWFGGNTTTTVLFDVGNKQVTVNTVDIISDSGINCATLNTTGAMTFAGATSVTGVVTPSGSGYVKKKTSALTANTTLNATHIGGIVTNRGAGGAITITVPDSGSFSGGWFEYHGLANQDVAFSAATAGDLVGLNDAAVNSVHFNTANEKIGAHATFFSDGTSWFVAASQGTLTLVT